MQKILKDLGGWPVVEGSAWDESKFDWVDVLTSLRKFGYDHNILLSLAVEVDVRNTTHHIIEVSAMFRQNNYFFKISDSFAIHILKLRKYSVF